MTREVVSEKYPPTAAAHIVSTFEHRNGDRVIYRRGLIPLSDVAYKEVGWCHHCADEIWAENGAGKFIAGHVPAMFVPFDRRHGWYKCPACAEKYGRWKVLRDQAHELHRQMREIEGEIAMVPVETP